VPGILKFQNHQKLGAGDPKWRNAD
jgi:hypothetical protein